MPAPKKVPSETPGELDKIRDLLFGEEVQGLREEIVQLREEVQNLRAELSGQIEAGNASSGSQFEAVNDAVTELRTQQVSRGHLARMLGNLAESLHDGPEPARENAAQASDG